MNVTRTSCSQFKKHQNKYVLAELPGFARDSRSIIIHTCVSGSFPTIQYVTPNPPPQCPSGSRGANFFSQLCPFTCRRICIRVPNLFTIGPAVLHLSNIFLICDPQAPSNVPWARGVNLLAYFYPLMNLYTCAKFGPDRASGL